LANDAPLEWRAPSNDPKYIESESAPADRDMMEIAGGEGL
jgi:hypothetical protein